MVKKTFSTFSLIGERCSGTNWVHRLITENFNIKNIRYPGFKHWPDFKKPRPQNNHVTIYLIRNGLDWLRSFYKTPHYVHYRDKNIKTFMFKKPFISKRSRDNVIQQDMDLETHCPYQDLWNMRESKHNYWIKQSTNLEHYNVDTALLEMDGKNNTITTDLWVRYEDILEDPERFLNFMSIRFALQKLTVQEYNLLESNYKHSVTPGSFNQKVHKTIQFYNNIENSVAWIKEVMGIPLGIIVLAMLINSKIEEIMKYKQFYLTILSKII